MSLRSHSNNIDRIMERNSSQSKEFEDVSVGGRRE